MRLGNVNWYYLLFTFFFTVATYNYMRLFQIRSYSGEHGFNQKFWFKQRVVQASFFTVVFSLIGSWFYLKIASWTLVMLSILPGLISLLYPLSFRNPMQSFTSLRTIPGLKVFLIASSWAYITFLIPVIYWYDIQPLDWVEFGMRVFLIIALIIPFDIRDLQMDDSQLRTLPQVLGVHRSKLLAMVLLGLYLVWKFIQHFLGCLTPEMLVAWTLGLMYAAVLIYKMNVSSSEIRSSFWIEGTPVLVVVLELLFSQLYY